MVFGIALNHVLVPNVLPFVHQEVQKEYVNLKTSHNIHTQSSHSHLKNWPKFLKYENINSNDTLPKLRGGKYDYSSFDCKVTSHVDFSKLYLDNHMAKFNAFDDTCDASAVLTLLGKVPVFSTAVQSAANDVRQARNSWAHCLFSNWNEAGFQNIFFNLKQLVNTSFGISNVDLLNYLNDWEKKGNIYFIFGVIVGEGVKEIENVKTTNHRSQFVLMVTLSFLLIRCSIMYECYSRS